MTMSEEDLQEIIDGYKILDATLRAELVGVIAEYETQLKSIKQRLEGDEDPQQVADDIKPLADGECKKWVCTYNPDTKLMQWLCISTGKFDPDRGTCEPE